MIPLTVPQKCITAVLVSLPILGVLAWGYWVIAESVARSDTVFAEIQTGLASLEEARRDAGKAEALMERRREDFIRISNFFVDRERPVAFIEDIEKLARLTGNEISLTIAEGAGARDAILFRITIDGTDGSVFKMLKLMELMPYHLTINDIAFQRSRQDNRSIARLLISFTVKAKS